MNILKEDFDINQYLYSDTAIQQQIAEQMSPSDGLRKNLFVLHCCIVIPLLKALPGQLVITSGYRCERLNKAVGGVANSYHIKGMAVDLNYFEQRVKRDDKLKSAVESIKLKHTEFLDEHQGEWVHLAYDINNLKS